MSFTHLFWLKRTSIRPASHWQGEWHPVLSAHMKPQTEKTKSDYAECGLVEVICTQIVATENVVLPLSQH